MKVLVVVDMQKDFVNKALGTAEAVAIVPEVVKKIKEFDGAVAVTYDTHHENYLETQEGKNLPVPHCIEGTDGWELDEAVAAAVSEKNAKVFKKPTFGSVELSAWLTELDAESGIDEIVFIGLCTDICVISNALLAKAALPEVKVTVDAACCAGVTPESHTNALAAMKMCQINIENG